jgi:hypothetical protein
MSNPSIPISAFAAACVSGLLLPSLTLAQVNPPCAGLTNPVYLKVGATQQPLMKALGRALRDEADPITLVYVTSGSCANTEYIYNNKPIDNATAFYVPSTAEDASWNTSKTALSCTVPLPAGLPIDIANSATYVSSCGQDYETPPAGITAFSGPIQGYGFVVPKNANTPSAITAEEAYFAYGFGSNGQVMPWNDTNYIYRLPASLSTMTCMAGAAGIFPFSKAAVGTTNTNLFASPNALLDALLKSPAPEKTLGIVGLELYDHDREHLKLLAFKSRGQDSAYFPDSTSTSFDKKNLRDGHYTPWAPTVWITKTDGDGKPTNPRAKRVIDLILSNPSEVAPSFDPLELLIGVNLVPLCAMEVTREPYESDPLKPYQPEQPCRCLYESIVDKATPADCTPCDVNTPCQAGTCSHGFCEQQVNYCKEG